MKFSPLLGLWLATIVVLAAEPSAQRGNPAVPHVRTVHVSAVDRKEAPVTDLAGAIMQVVAVTRAAQLNPTSVPTAKDKPADLLEHQLDINRVLGDGPKQTGGRRVDLITYIVPAGEKLNQKLSVSSKRRGITIRAPARASRGNP